MLTAMSMTLATTKMMQADFRLQGTDAGGGRHGPTQPRGTRTTAPESWLNTAPHTSLAFGLQMQLAWVGCNSCNK